MHTFTNTHSTRTKKRSRAAAGFNAIMEGQRICTRGTASNTHTHPVLLLQNLGLSDVKSTVINKFNL